MEPVALGASLNVKILTFPSLQLQSHPHLSSTSFRPFALHLVIFYSLYEMSLQASKALWQQQ